MAEDKYAHMPLSPNVEDRRGEILSPFQQRLLAQLFPGPMNGSAGPSDIMQETNPLSQQAGIWSVRPPPQIPDLLESYNEEERRMLKDMINSNSPWSPAR